MREIRIRGAAYLSARSFLVERFGADSLVEVFRAMDAEDVEVVEGIETQTEWAPFDVWARFVENADRVLGSGDFALARESGHWAAQTDLRTIFPEVQTRRDKRFVLLELASRFWHFYYDSGRAEAVASDDPNHEVFEVIDFASPHRVHCERILGWLEGAHSFLGLNVEVSMPECKAKGDERCLYLFAPRKGQETPGK